MNILFIREYPLIDGTFTLFIRLAQKMKEDGHSSVFLFFTKNIDDDLLRKIRSSSTIIYLDELPELKRNGQLPTVDVIHGLISGQALLKTYEKIQPVYFPQVPVVIGIYHPRALFTDTILGPSADTKLHKNFLNKIPEQNVVFINETVKATHRNYFKISFKNSPIIPILSAVPNLYKERREVNRQKIISIGRLVDFKNYIFPVINTIKDLNEQGYNFQYHIYGEGPLKKEIVEFISLAKMKNSVFLHGNVPYKNFEEILRDAFVFIGMGTSIIEASGYGLPSILAVENFKENNYGWFFDQQGYEIGEQIEGKQTFTYKELILEAYNASFDHYQNLCYKGWKRAQAFSIDVIIKDYYKFIENAQPGFNFKISLLQKLFLKIARQPLKINGFIKQGYRDK